MRRHASNLLLALCTVALAGGCFQVGGVKPGDTATLGCEAADQATWYADADGDGFGDAATPTDACTQPTGFAADATDCDDSDAAVHPGAPEVCDSVDDDCDGLVDGQDGDLTDGTTWCQDADRDGYGDAAISSYRCSQPAGYVADCTDCDDGDAAVVSCEGDAPVVVARLATLGASQVAVDPDEGLLYVSEWGLTTVAVFETAGFSLVERIDIGGQPNPVAIDEAGGFVLVGDVGNGDVVVLDRSSRAIVDTIGGFSNPHNFAVDDAGGSVFVVDHGTGEIRTLDASSLAEIGSLSLSAGLRQPACGGEVLFVVSNGGVVTRIDAASLSVRGSLALAGSLYGAAYVPMADRLLVSGFSEDKVYIIEASSMTLVGEIAVGAPYQACADPDSGVVAVPGYSDGRLYFIDTATDTITASLATCANAIDVAYDPTLEYWFVACQGSSEVVVVSYHP